MTLCTCGHARERHAQSALIGGLLGCFECATCKGFVPSSVTQKTPLWVLLARMAEHVRRQGERARVNFATPGDERNVWACSVAMPEDERLDRAMHDDEEVSLVEMLGSQLLEHAQTLEREARSHDASSARLEPPNAYCAVCAAKAGEWCMPVGPHERACGTWTHPQRGTEMSSFTRGRVSRWAFSDLTHSKRTKTLQIEDNLYIEVDVVVREYELNLIEAVRNLENARQEIYRLTGGTAPGTELYDGRGRDLANARQSCTRCSGSGVAHANTPCHCAAGDVATFTAPGGSGRVTGRELKSRNHALRVDPRIARKDMNDGGR